MDKKLLYESPSINVFEVQTEGVVCVSSAMIVWGELGQAGHVQEYNNYASDF